MTDNIVLTHKRDENERDSGRIEHQLLHCRDFIGHALGWLPAFERGLFIAI